MVCLHVPILNGSKARCAGFETYYINLADRIIVLHILIFSRCNCVSMSAGNRIALTEQKAYKQSRDIDMHRSDYIVDFVRNCIILELRL